MKRRNKIVQEITRNVANGFVCFFFFFFVCYFFFFFFFFFFFVQFLCNNSDRTFFQCINIRQVPWEVLKIAASGLGFQHLPRDLANVNA